MVSSWFADSKTRGAADRCPRQIVKENLSPYFGVFGIFEGTLSRRQTGAGRPAGGGSNCPSAPVDPNPLSASRESRPRGRLFAAKLPVIVHYLPHQMLNHLLPDDAILLARQFCDCLRDRVDDFVGFTRIDLSEPAVASAKKSSISSTIWQ